MVTREEIIEIINNCLQEYEIKFIDSDEIKIEDIGIDSIKLIKIIVYFEEKFSMEFDIDNMSYDTIQYCAKLINFILSQINNGILL